MKANTIKIEEDLLKRIYPLLAPKQSLANFVRTTLEREIVRQKLRSSAAQYLDFINSNQEEQELLNAWTKTELEKAPKTKNKK